MFLIKEKRKKKEKVRLSHYHYFYIDLKGVPIIRGTLVCCFAFADIESFA